MSDTSKDKYEWDESPIPDGPKILMVIEEAESVLKRISGMRIPAAAGICLQHAHRDLMDARRMLLSFERVRPKDITRAE